MCARISCTYISISFIIPVQVHWHLHRVCSYQQRPVLRRGLERRFTNQYEHIIACAHFRECRPSLYLVECLCPGSPVPDGFLLSVHGLHVWSARPRGLLCTSELLARHCHFVRNEQLGKSASVFVRQSMARGGYMYADVLPSECYCIIHHATETVQSRN